MRIKNWSGLYGLGYTLISIGIYGFYKKFEIKGKENIPIGKPILFAANHQNAFLDGAIIGYAISKPIYFLGRADIFRNKMSNWALGGLNCLPIYRERDGADYLVKNQEVFEQFYNVIEKQHPIVIFPEGSHAALKHIRGPLKKGVFRIGVGAEKKFGKSLDVHVVPVGIEYDKHSKMGGDLLLTFGEPIRVLDYLVDDEKDQEKEYNALISTLQKRLSRLIIDVKELDYYNLIMAMEGMFQVEILENNVKPDRNLFNKMLAQKSFVNKIENFIKKNGERAKDLQDLEHEFSTSISENGMRSWLFRKEKHPVAMNMAVLILLFPFHVYGLITNYLPYTIPNYWVNKKIKDVNFHASIKIILGTLSFLFFWFALLVPVVCLTENCLWVYFCISLPLSAIISQYYWLKIAKLRGKIRYNKLMASNSEYANKVRNQYKTLKKNFNLIQTFE